MGIAGSNVDLVHRQRAPELPDAQHLLHVNHWAHEDEFDGGKYFKEKCLSTLATSFLQIFCKIILNS